MSEPRAVRDRSTRTVAQAVTELLDRVPRARNRIPVFFRSGAGVVALRQVGGARDTIVITVKRNCISRKKVVSIAQQTLGLSPKQAVVAYLIAAGESVPAIAEFVGASVNTVKRHTETIYLKLGAKGRSDVERSLAAEVGPILYQAAQLP